MNMTFWIRIGLAMMIVGTPASVVRADSPKELGRVAWDRDFGRAVEKSRKDGRPLLVLFQEVPGCATCVGYGHRVLSHPLVVEAIESLFVPAAVFNNKEGEDERVLRSFDEPAWNNPVVRIMSADRKELAPRVGDDYSAGRLLSAMAQALRKIDRPVPIYLQLLADEHAPGKIERGTFAMDCFWSGESRLGSLPGVISTRSGFVAGHEAVEVVFDAAKLPYDHLVGAAKSLGCARRVFVENEQQRRKAAGIVGEGLVGAAGRLTADHEPKYYLAQTVLKYVPMSGIQAARVNAALGSGANPEPFLSPRQIDLWTVIRRYPNAGWKNRIDAPDLARAWDESAQIAAAAQAGKKM